MKRLLGLAAIIFIIFGSATIFAVHDSRAIILPPPEPVCRAWSSEGKCLVRIYPGNTVTSQRIETIRKNIFWAQGSYSLRDFEPRGTHLPLP